MVWSDAYCDFIPYLNINNTVTNVDKIPITISANFEAKLISSKDEKEWS